MVGPAKGPPARPVVPSVSCTRHAGRRRIRSRGVRADVRSPHAPAFRICHRRRRGMPRRDSVACSGGFTGVCGCRNKRCRHESHFGHRFLHMVTEAKQVWLPGTKCCGSPGLFHHGAINASRAISRIDASPYRPDPRWLSQTAREVRVDRLREFSLFGVREISGPQRNSGYQKRSRAMATTQRHPMTRFSWLGMAAILSTAITAPLLASSPARHREITVVGLGKADLTMSAPFISSSKRWLETATRPWSAPVGHRQPRAADVPAPTSRQNLEDANVDRKINSVCRGC
jgi:hypothetical protein